MVEFLRDDIYCRPRWFAQRTLLRISIPHPGQRAQTRLRRYEDALTLCHGALLVSCVLVPTLAVPKARTRWARGVTEIGRALVAPCWCWILDLDLQHKTATN